MEGQLQVEHARSRRHHDTYALIMADLDLFKKVNDTHGHDVGMKYSGIWRTACGNRYASRMPLPAGAARNS